MDLSKTQLIESVFAGGGEMRARMRAFDWSTTPLGPVERWPQSLRMCVRIVLGSGYPMAILWGPDYAFLYNDAFRPMMGQKHPWALGRSCREVFPESWDFAGPLFDRVMTQGHDATTLTDQLFLINRNNYLEECYFASSYSPIPDDKGDVGGALTIALETTERVLEDRRRQVLRDLASRTAGARNEEEVWRVSAETLGQDRLSLPFAFLYEYRPSEHRAYLAGVSVETDGALHPGIIDCRSENLWRFDPALTRDGVVLELGNRASRVSVANWPAPPKEASVVPIRLGEYSEALGFLVVGIHPGRAFDDAYRQFVYRITEQITIGLASARAFEQERQRAEALAELDRAKTTFFSNVSHEFRTPLTLMLGPLEEVLPKARERLSPKDHEQLAAVRRNGLRLLKLVNTLLDFSRIEAGPLQASYQATDLAGFTSGIASAFDSAMENAGLRFSVECQPIAEPVYVDHDMWEKVVLNLLSNALKFTFGGEVALTLKTADGMVELQVRDTGVGIPEEHRQRVFERFHRIEGTHARTYEGTGIGLALVQELVKLHGGSVRVESALGQGSTFTVTIPSGKDHLPAERIQAAQSFASTKIRAEAYVEEAQQWLGDESGAVVDVAMTHKAASFAPSPEPKPGPKRELIILADDNADMRQYLAHILADRYEVRGVADGRQALEATRQLRPALVLADVMMPELDGFGLLRAIRDDSALASTPVILVSARAGEESRVEGLQATADDYLVKPFTSRELLARVTTHVKMAHLRRVTAGREERLRNEAEIERQKLHASQELLAETSRLYRELQNREAKIRRLVDANIIGIFTWNLEGKILEANDAFLRMVEYNRDDLLSGRVCWADLTPAEWQERDARATAELKETGRVQTYEKDFFRKDGSRVPVLVGAASFEAGGNEGVAFVLDLSEQKRSEERYRIVVETASDAVITADESGLILFTNPATKRIFGYDSTELIGRPLTTLMPEFMRKLHEAGFKRYLATGQRHINWQGTEFIGMRKNGEEFPLEISFGEQIRNGHRVFTGFVRDISEKRRAEEALRRSEAYLLQAQRLAHMGSWVWQVAGRKTVYLSEEWYRVYGFDPKVGMPTWEERLQRVHPEDRAKWQAAIDRAIDEKSDYDLEFRILPPDTAVGYIHSVGHPVFDSSGELVQFVGVSMDVTESKQAEQAFRLLVVGTAATTGSDFFHSLVQHMAQALRGRYAFVATCDDQKHARTLAFWKGDGFGENFEFDIADTPCKKVLHGEVCHYRQGLQRLFPLDKILADWQAESYLGVPMLDQNNRVLGHIAILDDKPMEADSRSVDLLKIFASRAAAELKRQKAEDELRAALQEGERMREELAHLAHQNRVSTMGELAASLAHEIKQPISAAMTDARTCSRWLTRDHPDLAEAQAAASRVVKDVARASEIIGRVRSLFKKDSLQREEVDINELIQEMIALLRSEASKHSILIDSDFSVDLPPMMADRVQLQQVLMNLMLNSIEAMKSMNTPGKLTIKSQQDDSGQLLISVTDSGVGVPPEKTEQIFDAFFTSKPQGTGMGLAISRSIIVSHGGRLWAVSNPGSGATFHFTLPIQRNAQQAAKLDDAVGKSGFPA